MATPAKRGQPRVAVEWQWRRDKTRQVRTPAAVARTKKNSLHLKKNEIS